MEGLIPAFSRVIFNHLAIELEVIALCGLIKEINNFFSPWRRSAVRPRYTCRVLTGHNILFVGKEGKKKDSIGFP